ncbi:hypothetical protein [Azospirillum sp. B2RO_4]|uniref:hypothetical protein n=1 Tax=Azospirillum sp. B2RO_4 TaxID=3027796 RepID=UPI003DA8E376
MNLELHRHRAEAAWPVLAKAAERNSLLTYKELSDAIGVHWRVANLYLGIIQKYCKEKDLPPLQSIAVNAKTGLPGNGYSGSSNNKKAHNTVLADVYKHDWSNHLPDFSNVKF